MSAKRIVVVIEMNEIIGRSGALTGILGEGAPVALAVLLDVGDELLVLLRRPRPLLQPALLAARRAPHGSRLLR